MISKLKLPKQSAEQLPKQLPRQSPKQSPKRRKVAESGHRVWKLAWISLTDFFAQVSSSHLTLAISSKDSVL
jgi:hypothetical protein